MGVPEKLCISCGRSIAWRRKWARDWENVRYCSDACRRDKPADIDRRLEQAILDLLFTRSTDATICPSEAARRVDPTGWRDLMQRARSAARRLVGDGKIVMKQAGRVVDPSRARGPVRLARRG